MQQDLFAEEHPIEKPVSALPIIKKGKVKLTPAQSEFNRLNKKIALLKEDLNSLPEKKRRVGEFYQQTILPLMKESNNLLITAVTRLDAEYDQKGLCDEDLLALSDLILNKSNFLMQTSVDLEEDEKKKISDLIRKHEMLQTGLSSKELEKQKVKDMLRMFTMLTGIKPTDKMKKAKTEEALSGLIGEFLEEQTQEEFKRQNEESNKQDPFDAFGFKEPGRREEREEPKQKRKMTQTELKRKMQEEQTLKSIRSIYMELAKELHPDREQDEALRVVKEEQMKQLTEAYKNKDLSALLTMQISWLQESVKATPGELSDVVLKGYNKVLKSQLAKLKDEQQMNVYSMLNVPREMSRLLLVPVATLEYHFANHLYQEQLALSDMFRQCKSWNTKRGLNKLIREHKEEQSFDNFLGDDLMGDFLDDLMEVMRTGKMKF